MSASGGNDAVLAKALNDLLKHWEQTASAWKDRAREDFDKDFIRELAPAVRAASGAIQDIEQLLQTVKKECS